MKGSTLVTLSPSSERARCGLGTTRSAFPSSPSCSPAASPTPSSASKAEILLKVRKVATGTQGSFA